MKNKRADPPTVHARSVALPSVEVAAGLVFRNHLLLITQRLPGDHLGGLWEFPGGKREPPETFEDCLRRELREELGVEIEVQELFDSLTYDYPEKSVHLKFYCCRWRQEEPRALGCQALAWVNSAQLADYCFPPADQQLLKKLRASPELWR
jgi:8-oxo-dGTP diphosphatase